MPFSNIFFSYIRFSLSAFSSSSCIRIRYCYILSNFFRYIFWYFYSPLLASIPICPEPCLFGEMNCCILTTTDISSATGFYAWTLLLTTFTLLLITFNLLRLCPASLILPSSATNRFSCLLFCSLRDTIYLISPIFIRIF